MQVYCVPFAKCNGQENWGEKRSQILWHLWQQISFYDIMLTNQLLYLVKVGQKNPKIIEEDLNIPLQNDS